ncbi:MAG: hypothetical protein RI957_1507 [Verrucomicrobiota bacterium]
MSENFPVAIAVGEVFRAHGVGGIEQREDKKKVSRRPRISYGWAGGGARDGSSPATIFADGTMLRRSGRFVIRCTHTISPAATSKC